MKRLILLLLLASPLYGAIGFVNGACSTNGGTPGTTLALSYSPTAGNALVVSMSISVSVANLSIRDNNNNALSPGGSILHAAQFVGYAVAGANIYTVNWTSTAKASMCITEYSGVASFGASNNTNSGTGTAPTISVTTTGNNNWIVADFGAGGAATFTSTTGNLREQENAGGGNNNAVGVFDNTASTPSSVTNTGSTNISTPWGAVAVELKSTGAAVRTRHKVNKND